MLELTDVEVRYGAIRAVRGITLTAGRGELVALLGANGAGKTSTLMCVAGALRAAAGTIRLDGRDVTSAAPEAMVRNGVATVTETRDVFPDLTVAENLTVYGHLYGLAGGLSGVRRRVAEIAEALDVARFLKKPTGQLSAGQKTRVALAKALLNRPDVLLLDEPTASLDPDTADWIRTYLETYRRETGATILLASHNMLEVERLCGLVLMMRGGAIVDRGTPAELLERYGRDTLEDVFLDIARDRRRGGVADAAE